MMNLLGFNILIFIGIFIITEALFSIIYYFDGNPLPHVFRAIRVVFGVYLVWKGYYGITAVQLVGVGPATIFFFTIVGLSVLAGYEVAKVLEEREKKREKKEKHSEE